MMQTQISNQKTTKEGGTRALQGEDYLGNRARGTETMESPNMETGKLKKDNAGVIHIFQSH